MKRKPKLHLVGNDPSEIFDDIDKLRSELEAPVRRGKMVETFARIPHRRALDLYRHKISGAAWLILIELDRLILKAGGRNPVRLWSSKLRDAGVRHQTRARALRQLEAVGVIKIEYRGNGLSPWVTHLWLRRQN